MTRIKPAAATIVLLLALAPPAAAQQPVTPIPVPPVPILPVVDPVARAMAQQALAAATAPVVVKTTLVGGASVTTPPVTDAVGTLGTPPVQVVGSDANNTGYIAFKYGNDGKGLTNYWVKTRGTVPNSYGAVRANDRIVTDLWQAGTGSQTGHVGGTQVTVDSATFTAGEVAGRWSLFTGTGIHVSQASKLYPSRYGSIDAIVANSFQQVLFPGGTGSTDEDGPNFGGWVVIGAGASSPGFGPLKFTAKGAALLAVPEVGAFEVDAAARPYFTAGDGVRRAFVLADTAAPTVRVLAGAGLGASVSIDAAGAAGTVTLFTGTVPAAGGDLFAVTYAHPYPVASYPVIAAGNAAAAILVRGGYLTATATGFTVSLPPGTAAAASTSYTVTFNAPGR